MSPSQPPRDRFPERIRKAYTAVKTHGGRVLPIVETVGRRVLREIDPESPEGARLLEEGRVELWSERGLRAARRAPGPPASLEAHRGLKRIPPRKPPAES